MGMRVPLSWLRDYVDLTLPLEELAHRLTLAGLEVEDIEYIGIPAPQRAAQGHLVWDREKIVLGHILEVKPHPDADRLVLAMVDSGIGEVETVVTGAPNLYPYSGRGPLNPPLVVAYAREGAEVIDGHKDDGSRLIIKPRKLRGIENRSMVCSEKELGLSDEHEGIMLLESDAAPGTPLQDVLGDAILDIALTPNLARCFSIIGVAREVAALTGQKVRYPDLSITAAGTSIETQAAIEITRPDLNPRFMLALLKGVTIGSSPDWLQRRLKMVGMRPINNIVDITNYVMMEYGEPLHAFDYDVLVERAGGRPPTIITRLPRPGERLTTLDDVERDLDEFTILVCDTAGALSLGGIMGGAESEVRDTTVNVLLEAASWNFINIRQTLSAQRERGKEIVSEAAVRFSRGVHPAQAENGLRRAIEMMRQVAGGEIAAGILDNYPHPAPAVTVDLPMSEVERVLGIPLDRDAAAAILRGLEFEVEPVGSDALRATVPDHRLDIGHLNDPKDEDIADVIARADLLEEIARIYGYDRIPNTLLDDVLPPQRSNVTLEGEELVRDLLVESGLQEIISYRLTTPEREALLTPPGASPDWPDVPYVTLANPISRDRTVMRHTLLASMLDVLAANARWRTRQALFEVGQVYLPVEGEKLPSEPRRLCIALTGERGIAAWQDGPGQDMALMDYFDLKGVIERLVEGLHLHDVRFEAGQHSSFYPGRTAVLQVNGGPVGVLGELHPLVIQAFGLPDRPVMAAELDLDALLALAREDFTVRPVSSYPVVYQDIAVVVDESMPAQAVEQAIREAGGALLAEVRLFDVYRGSQIGAGKKSLAYALAFQAPDRPLRDKDVDRLRGKIIATLERRLDARLRA
ncbi:MAG: phenylalanine--tRNA ligase subunit beta [Anaerolineae bacterium]